MPRYTAENELDRWRVEAVYLNGKALEDCFEADTDAGTVVVPARDEKGRLVIEGDKIMHKTLTGLVTVKLRERDYATDKHH